MRRLDWVLLGIIGVIVGIVVAVAAA